MYSNGNVIMPALLPLVVALLVARCGADVVLTTTGSDSNVTRCHLTSRGILAVTNSAVLLLVPPAHTYCNHSNGCVKEIAAFPPGFASTGSFATETWLMTCSDNTAEGTCKVDILYRTRVLDILYRTPVLDILYRTPGTRYTLVLGSAFPNRQPNYFTTTTRPPILKP